MRFAGRCESPDEDEMRMRKGDGYEIPCVGSRASQARRLGSRPGKGQDRTGQVRSGQR